MLAIVLHYIVLVVEIFIAWVVFVIVALRFLPATPICPTCAQELGVNIRCRTCGEFYAEWLERQK